MVTADEDLDRKIVVVVLRVGELHFAFASQQINIMQYSRMR
jgi:hypothetical protein